MARTTYPKDRFDDVVVGDGRVGAHRAHNPRTRAGLVVLWAVVATAVLVTIGIFGTLLATGRISLESTPTPSPTPTVEIVPVVDTSYQVLVLNATPQGGLAGQLRTILIGAGWDPDAVIDSDAGSDDFQTTTVYYVDPVDEAAALGLANLVGGAAIAQSDVYASQDPAVRQLAVVIGLDRLPPPETPAP